MYHEENSVWLTPLNPQVYTYLRPNPQVYTTAIPVEWYICIPVSVYLYLDW